jgi:hypothetical protein
MNSSYITELEVSIVSLLTGVYTSEEIASRFKMGLKQAERLHSLRHHILMRKNGVPVERVMPKSAVNK